MALTRKFLKALNVEDAAIEEIITAHTEVLEAVKSERDEERKKAAKADELKAELDALKKDIGEKYVEKATYDKAVKDLEDFKADVDNKAKASAIDKAVRAYLTENKITGNNQDIAVMAMAEITKTLELDGEKIKDTKALDELIGGKFKGMQDGENVTINKNVPTPPANNGAPEPKPSRARELAAQMHATMFGEAPTTNGTKGE
jgi:hypothetical protein